MSDDGNNGLQLPLVWMGSDAPVLVANQFSIVATAEDEIFLTLGQVLPPVAVGATQEERREQMEKMGAVPVRPVGRFSLTRSRLTELHKLLDDLVKRFDDVQGEA